MSMNLHVDAEFKTVDPMGKPHTVYEHFDLWQTPTEITKTAIRSENPRQVYEEWLKKFPEKYPEAYSEAYIAYHLEELDKWLQNHEGWTIDWYEL